MFASAAGSICSLVPGDARRVLYLTFDDGPDEKTTPKVLDLLERHRARATFFVVAERAKIHRDLFTRLAKDHAIGDHSLDHSYRHFFGGARGLRAWIEQSERVFGELGVTPVGFRPPAGICTPPLREALNELQLPLVLWRHRFYDTTFTWTSKRLKANWPRLASGDIVLLHDRQRARSRSTFLVTLELFLTEATRLGWAFLPLPNDLRALNRRE